MFQKVKSWMLLKHGRVPAVNTTANATKISESRVGGYFEPLSVPDLLQHEWRRQFLKSLWEYSALPKERFERYFLTPLYEVVSLCQRLPASHQGKFARTDGMVDYVLQTTVYAVRLSKGCMLPRGATAEEQSAQSVSWSAVVYYAALFHSLGALWNIEGELQSGKVWQPGLSIPEEPYRFRFIAEPDMVGAQIFGEMIAIRFLPEPILQWLGKTPDILRTLLAFVSGRYIDATDITDIVNEAIVNAGGTPIGFSVEQESQSSDVPGTLNTAAELSPVLMQHPSTISPVNPVIAEVSQENTPFLSSLNSGGKPEGGDALIPAETNPDVFQVMSILGVLPEPDSLESEKEVVKTDVDLVPVPDAAIVPGIEENSTHLLAHSPPEVSLSLKNKPDVTSPGESITGNEDQERTNFPADSLSSLSPSELGNLFWMWLRDGLLKGDIPVNTTDASVHLTCGFIFISVPAVFFLFLHSHSCSHLSGLKESGRKEQVQAAFEKIRKHRVSDSRRFWQCCLYEEPGCRGKYKKLTGYLIKMSEIYAAGNFPSDSLFLKVIN